RTGTTQPAPSHSPHARSLSTFLMKTRTSAPFPLLALAFTLAFASTAGLTLWAADGKASSAKKAPAAEKSDTAAKPADDKRPPLRLNVDTKPIDRNAPDRVSYAPIIKRTAASVVHVYSS